jgi:pyridoxal phosphate enzyme (YggS family)
VSTIVERWRAVRARVDAACTRANRDPTGVTIVAVSKTHPGAAVREAAYAGATDFGEDYVQELVAKRDECTPDLRWHFIGRLQRNKAKLVAGKVALVHAVESVKLAEELAKHVAAGEPQPILLSVNLGGEATKGGCTIENAPLLARAVAGVTNTRLDGLMTMPPPEEDPRPHFVALRQLREDLQQQLGRPLPVLSMGMSSDFEIAIEHGATHVRIGTAIFGERRPVG